MKSNDLYGDMNKVLQRISSFAPKGAEMQSRLMKLEEQFMGILLGKYKIKLKDKDLPSAKSIIHVIKTSTLNGNRGMKFYEECIKEKKQKNTNIRQ